MAKTPPWTSELGRRTTELLTSIDALAPIGCHCHLDGEVWEITLFVSRTEVMGGRRDGSCTYSRFWLDVRGLLDLFDVVSACYWQARTAGKGDELGPHLAVEGSYDGHNVRLRVLSRPPRRFPAGRRANAITGAMEDMW